MLILLRLQDLWAGCRGHSSLQVDFLRRWIERGWSGLVGFKRCITFSKSELFLEVMSWGLDHSMLPVAYLASLMDVAYYVRFHDQWIPCPRQIKPIFLEYLLKKHWQGLRSKVTATFQSTLVLLQMDLELELHLGGMPGSKRIRRYYSRVTDYATDQWEP